MVAGLSSNYFMIWDILGPFPPVEYITYIPELA